MARILTEAQKARVAARKKAWYDADKERILESRKAYAKKYRVRKMAARTPEEAEAKKAYLKEYYKANREKAIAVSLAQYEADKERILEARKTYHKENRDTILARMMRYKDENREILAQKRKVRYDQNRDELCAKVRWYYKNSAEERRNYRKAYCKANRGKVTEARRRSSAARIRRTPTWLTPLDIWLMEEVYMLSELRTRLTGVQWHVDHIIPLQGRTVSGLHVPSNLQVIPAALNQAKSNSYAH